MSHSVHLWLLLRLWAWCPGMWCWSSRVSGCGPGVRTHHTWSRLPTGKLTFHFDGEARSSLHAKHFSTPNALKAAARERRVGLLPYYASWWHTHDLGALKILIHASDVLHKLCEGVGEREERLLDWLIYWLIDWLIDLDYLRGDLLVEKFC